MNKSETIGELAKALSIFQNTVQDVFKSKSGYGYSYADLSGILEEVRPGLAANGLAVTQLCNSMASEGHPYVGIETVLMHSSGEWISSSYYMQVQVAKGLSLAQASGSVITYARRYALAAILGITQTDNDASIKEELPAKKVEVTKADPFDELIVFIKSKGAIGRLNEWKIRYKVGTLKNLTVEQMNEIKGELNNV